MPEPVTKQSAPSPWIHAVALLVIAPLSMLAGFFLVTGRLPGQGRATIESRDAGLAAPGDTPRGDGDVTAGDGAPPSPAEDAVEQRTTFEGLQIRPAPRIAMGEPHYWRCFEKADGEPRFEEACGRLRPLERRVASRMGSVVSCYNRLDMHGKTGTLHLAIDFNFTGVDEEGSDAAGSLRFWAGRSTKLDGADALVTCIRSRLDDLDLRHIKRQFERYTIFFPIEFQPFEGEGTPAELVQDRVRLRREPVNGQIVARLKQGEPLVLLERRDGWVRLRTVDGREGWVYEPAVTIPDL